MTTSDIQYLNTTVMGRDFLKALNNNKPLPTLDKCLDMRNRLTEEFIFKAENEVDKEMATQELKALDIMIKELFV